MFHHAVNHIYDDSGRKLSLDALLKGDTKDIWWKGLSNEIGRLAQGNDFGVTPNDCMEFIFHHEVPKDKKVTYENFVCDYRPTKSEPWRVRLVVGGDEIDYFADAGSPTTTTLETKILLNSTISDSFKGARFMTCDLKDFFLCSYIASPEYVRIHNKYLPSDIISRYNLHSKLHHGYIYFKIDKGMYGLPQAAILAYEQLCEHLSKAGYYPIPGTSGMFKHTTYPTVFNLCVDGFGTESDAEHLLHL